MAKLAGIPGEVLTEAHARLAALEAGVQPASISMAPAATAPARPASPLQVDLFNSPSHPAVEALEELDPDDLTPRQALEALYSLRNLLN